MPENSQQLCKNGRTDPTANVTNILHEAVKRQDDLRGAETKRIDGILSFITEKFESIIKAIDVKYQIQFNAAEKAIAIAQTAQEKLVASALDGTKEAINKADVATDKRFSLLSEKIDEAMERINKNVGERGIYVTHTDLTNSLGRLQENIEIMIRPVITFMNSQQGGAKSTNMVWVYIGLGVTTLGAIGALILNALRLSGLGL